MPSIITFSLYAGHPQPTGRRARVTVEIDDENPDDGTTRIAQDTRPHDLIEIGEILHDLGRRDLGIQTAPTMRTGYAFIWDAAAKLTPEN